MGLLIIVEIFIFYKYINDNIYFLNISKNVINSSDTQNTKVIKLLEYVREKIPSKKNDRYFLLPIFKFMRPTPRQVIEFGGYCANKSRLLITLLQLNGISASKIALYDDAGVSQHAVVEVEINKGEKMVVDPTYGLYFPKGGNTYYNLDDLRKDEKILVQRIKELVMDNLKNDHIPDLSKYPLNQYVYRHPRTINWEKSIFMKCTYTLLSLMLGERINYIKRPTFVERPVLMIFYVGIFFIIFIYCIYRRFLTNRKNS